MYVDLAPHTPDNCFDLSTGAATTFERRGENAVEVDVDAASHPHGIALTTGRTVLCIVLPDGDVLTPTPASAAGAPWLFHGARGGLVLRGAWAHVPWTCAPLWRAPEMRVVLQRTLEMLDATHTPLCAPTARGFAWQCLLVCMRAHSAATPGVVDFMRLLRDVAENCDALCESIPLQYAAPCRALFGPAALAEHRPRAGSVRLQTGAVRDVVVLHTRTCVQPYSVLELVDPESAALIVPTKKAAEALVALESGATTVYAFADARAVYDAVLWYGDSACVAGGDSPRLGIAPYAAVILHPSVRRKKRRQLSAGAMYLVCEAYAEHYVPGCTGQARALARAERDDGARAWERSALARCAFVVPAAPAPLRRALWCLALRSKEHFRPPAPRLANRLVANLNTSVAHKVDELGRELGVRAPAEIAEACSVLEGMCRLSMAGDVRAVVERRLQNAQEKLSGDKPAIGKALASIVLLGVYLHAYI